MGWPNCPGGPPLPLSTFRPQELAPPPPLVSSPHARPRRSPPHAAVAVAYPTPYPNAPPTPGHLWSRRRRAMSARALLASPKPCVLRQRPRCAAAPALARSCHLDIGELTSMGREQMETSTARGILAACRCGFDQTGAFRVRIFWGSGRAIYTVTISTGSGLREPPLPMIYTGGSQRQPPV